MTIDVLHGRPNAQHHVPVRVLLHINGADQFARLLLGDYAGSPLSPTKEKGSEVKDTEDEK